MDELILVLFRMRHSTYAQPLPDNLIRNAAFGISDHNLQLSGGFFVMPEQAAAGLWTTPTDLALFGIEIMKALRNESMWLSRSSAAVMTTPLSDGYPYGVGLAITEYASGLNFGHGGSNYGYRCMMRFSPDDGSGIVVMLNSYIGAVIIREVMAAYEKVVGWIPVSG